METFQQVSMILPAFNEENYVENVLTNVLDSLKDIGYKFELIFVDDGSTDLTREKLLKFCINPNIKVIGYPKNRGKGYAIKFGLSNASGDIIVFMDSDKDIKTKQLALYLEKVKSSDIVIASKRHPQSKVKQPLIRKLLSISFNKLVKLLTGIKVSDTQSGFKVMRAESMKKIMPLLSVKKYAFDVEMLTVATLLKMRIEELPIDIQMVELFKFRDILRMFIDLLGITYRLRVKRWYQKNINNFNAEYLPVIKW